MGYRIKHICPFLSFSGTACHHIYAERNKRNPIKTVCIYYNNQDKCPLFKLWKEQLDKQLQKDSTIEKFIKSK